MSWSARPSLLPSGMEDQAVPAFPASTGDSLGGGAPWLPEELPEQPVHDTRRTVDVDGGARGLADHEAEYGDGAGTGRSSLLHGVAERGPLGHASHDYLRAESQRLAEEHAAKLEAGVAEARAEAYAAGEQAGREAARQVLGDAVAAAERALDTLRNADASWSGRLEENLCALAVGVARQLLSREVEQDPSLVSALVRQALIEFPIDQAVSIRINPRDLAAITALSIAGDSATGAAAGRDARWVADSELMPGDCVVEGRERIVDGRVDTALERMYRRLAEVQQ